MSLAADLGSGKSFERDVAGPVLTAADLEAAAAVASLTAASLAATASRAAASRAAFAPTVELPDAAKDTLDFCAASISSSPLLLDAPDAESATLQSLQLLASPIGSSKNPVFSPSSSKSISARSRAEATATPAARALPFERGLAPPLF